MKTLKVSDGLHRRAKAATSARGVQLQDWTEAMLTRALAEMAEWTDAQLAGMLGLPTDTPDSTEPVGQTGRCEDSDD